MYDVGEDHGISYIVMELVEGITLKEYIDKKGRLAVREATSIAIQVSMGLEAAHRNGIVHRDVKPQNIIISTDGKVKVTDFRNRESSQLQHDQFQRHGFRPLQLTGAGQRRIQ